MNDDEEIKSVTTEEQRENFIAQLNEAEDWLYSEESTAAEYRFFFFDICSAG